MHEYNIENYFIQSVENSLKSSDPVISTLQQQQKISFIQI